MAVSLAPVLKQKFTDANDDPLAGGKVYTYQSGTTTPQATYTDSTGGTPNANPVVLDANGEANIWLDVALSYKFVVKNSSDVTQYTTDGVIGLATNNSVATASLQDDAVTTAKLADDSVTADILADHASIDASRAVTTNHVRDSAITRAKLATGAVAKRTVRSVVTTDTPSVTADDVLNCSSASFTITLPTAAGNSGKIFEIVHAGTSGTQLYTVDGSGTETVGGQLTRVLYTNGESIKIISDGTNWTVLSRKNTFDLGTEAWTDSQANSTTSVRLFRRGTTLRAEGTISFTGAMSGAMTVTIPAIYTAAATYIYTNSKAYALGEAILVDAGSQQYRGSANLSAATTITIYSLNAAGTTLVNADLSATSPFTWANTDSILFYAEWEVVGWES